MGPLTHFHYQKFPLSIKRTDIVSNFSCHSHSAMIMTGKTLTFLKNYLDKNLKTDWSLVKTPMSFGIPFSNTISKYIIRIHTTFFCLFSIPFPIMELADTSEHNLHRNETPKTVIDLKNFNRVWKYESPI